MSITIYDSPEDVEPSLNIDATHDFIWFCSHEGDEMSTARVRKEELPAIVRAITDYLNEEES